MKITPEMASWNFAISGVIFLVKYIQSDHAGYIPEHSI